MTDNILVRVTDYNVAAIYNESEDFLKKQSFDLKVFDEIYQLNSVGTPILKKLKSNIEIKYVEIKKNELISLESYLLVGKHNTAVVLNDNFDLTASFKEKLMSCNIKLVLSSNEFNFNVWQRPTSLNYADLFLILNQPFGVKKLKNDIITIDVTSATIEDILKQMTILDQSESSWESTFHLLSKEQGLILSGLNIPRNAFKLSKDHNDISDLFYLSELKERKLPKLTEQNRLFQAFLKIYPAQPSTLEMNSLASINKTNSIKYGIDVKSGHVSFGRLLLKGRSFTSKGTLFHWAFGFPEEEALSLSGNFLTYNWKRNTGSTANAYIVSSNYQKSTIGLGIYAHKYLTPIQANLTAAINFENNDSRNNFSLRMLVNKNYSTSVNLSFGANVSRSTNNGKVFFELKNNLTKNKNSNLDVSALLNPYDQHFIFDEIFNYWHVVSSQLSQPLKDNWRKVFINNN